MIAFLLQRTQAGLCVRRERLQRGARVRLRHVALFADSASFEQWLDCDETRFDYPILHSVVRRQGSAYLESSADGRDG